MRGNEVVPNNVSVIFLLNLDRFSSVLFKGVSSTPTNRGGTTRRSRMLVVLFNLAAFHHASCLRVSWPSTSTVSCSTSVLIHLQDLISLCILPPALNDANSMRTLPVFRHLCLQVPQCLSHHLLILRFRLRGRQGL